MIYVASPYSSPQPEVREHRYRMVMNYIYHNTMSGLPRLFSPIQYTHEMAKHYNMPDDFAFWQTFCLSWLERADELHILKMEGWQESRGLQAEWSFAKQLGLPITEVAWGNS